MSKKIEILLDNGGGLQLQTAKFAHSYQSSKAGEQCATDIRDFLKSGDTSDWEGNQPEYRREPALSDDTLDRADLEAIVAAGEAIKRVGKGAMGRELITALLGVEACEAISREFESAN